MAESSAEPSQPKVPHWRYPDTCRVQFSPDGRLLALGCNRSIITYVSTSEDTVTSLGEMACHRGSVTDICFSSDSRFLASSSRDPVVQLWNVNPLSLSRCFLGHAGNVSCLTFKPQSTMFASGSLDKTIRIWDMSCEVCLRVIHAGSAGISAVDYSPDRSMIVAGSVSGVCGIWNTVTGKILFTIKERGMPRVGSVQFSSDGKYVLIGLLDSSLRIWSMEHGGLLPTRYVGHVNTSDHISSTFVRGDERYIVSGSEDNCLYIWDVMSGRLVRKIDEAHTAPVQSVTSHPTRKMVASASLKDVYTVKLWDINPYLETPPNTI